LVPTNVCKFLVFRRTIGYRFRKKKNWVK
jgi:hypothetical protein